MVALNQQQFEKVNVDPQRAVDFNRLTERGKAYYLDRRYSGPREDWATHETAFADAKHSYGTVTTSKFTPRRNRGNS